MKQQITENDENLFFRGRGSQVSVVTLSLWQRCIDYDKTLKLLLNPIFDLKTSKIGFKSNFNGIW